jgi:hypothetical protein
MSLRSLKQLLLAKVETAYNVDPIPTAALNAILVSNVKLNPLNATEVDRKVIMPYLGSLGKIIADTHVTLDFDVEFSPSGTAGTAPGWSPLMLGCAMAETIVAATSVTYSPISSGEKSLTLYLNIDGKQRVIKGARGNAKGKISPKGVAMLSFSFIGLYSPAADVVMPAGASYSAFKTPLPVNSKNTTLSLHGFAAPVSDFSFDAGVKNVYRSLIGAESVVLADRAPTGSITLEDNLVATKNWEAIVENATIGALTLTHGTVAGEKVQINAPAVQLHGMQISEADNIEMLQFNLIFQPTTAGNDDFSIVCL